MDVYGYLFDEMAKDIGMPKSELLEIYIVSNRSMILKKTDNPIGILIMEMYYNSKMRETISFIKIMWIRNVYRNKGYGSNTINNLVRYNMPIVLAVERKNTKAVDFYKQNLFEVMSDDPTFLWMVRKH